MFEYGLLLGIVAQLLSLLKLLKLVFLAAVTVGELHRAVVVSVQDRIAELLALLEPTASPLLLLLLLLLLLRAGLLEPKDR